MTTSTAPRPAANVWRERTSLYPAGGLAAASEALAAGSSASGLMWGAGTPESVSVLSCPVIRSNTLQAQVHAVSTFA